MDQLDLIQLFRDYKTIIKKGSIRMKTETNKNENSYRKIALIAGVLFLVTHVTSIGGLLLYEPVMNDPGFITGSGNEAGVIWGVLFEVFLALANIGTAIVLYPVVKKWGESNAIGYVAMRTLEAAVIAIGVIPILVIVTLRHQLEGSSGVDTSSYFALAGTLVSFHNWTFLVGPSFFCGTNTVLLAYLMYRSKLVPRFIPLLGLIGGPLVFVSGVFQMFGIYDQISLWSFIAAIPIFSWELSLAIRLVVKGFNSNAVGYLDA
jgi:hypothetical protein